MIIIIVKYLIMDDEILIEEVRQYDEIYDMSHRKYSDNQHRDLVWTKIGQKLNLKGMFLHNLNIYFINYFIIKYINKL